MRHINTAANVRCVLKEGKCQCLIMRRLLEGSKDATLCNLEPVSASTIYCALWVHRRTGPQSTHLCRTVLTRTRTSVLGYGPKIPESSRYKSSKLLHVMQTSNHHIYLMNSFWIFQPGIIHFFYVSR